MFSYLALDDWYQFHFTILPGNKNTPALIQHVTRAPKAFLLRTSQAKLLLLAPSTSQHGWQTNWSKHWKIICLQNFSGWDFSLLNFSYKNKMKDSLLDFPSIMSPLLMYYYSNVPYFILWQYVVNKMCNIFHQTPKLCDVGKLGSRHLCPADYVVQL